MTLTITKAAPRTREGRVLWRVARQAEPELRKMIMRIMVNVQDGADFSRVREVLQTGTIEQALDVVPWDRIGEPVLRREMLRSMRDVLEQAGDGVMQDMAARVDVRDAGFTVLNDRTSQWLQTEAAAQVTRVSDATRAGLRTTLSMAREEGLGAHRMAQMIKPMIGLTEPHATAVANMRERLREQGWAEARIDKETAAYARQLRQVRAMNIARTETRRASRAGQREAWEQAEEAGMIDRGKVERTWHTAGDGAVRDEHAQMEGEKATFDGVFTNPVTGQEHPEAPDPEDIGCRCFETLDDV